MNKKRIVLLLCILFLIVLFIRWKTYLLPVFLETSKTGHLLDTRFWYSINEGYRIISGFSEENFKIYNEFFLWDTILPFVYCYVTIVSISLLKLKNKYLFLFPILAMSFDYLENISGLLIMKSYPREFPLIMGFDNIVGTIKYSLQYITWLLLVISILFGTYRFIRSKVKISIK